MLKCTWGWIRRIFGKGLKKTPNRSLVEWELLPYSFQIDWYHVAKGGIPLQAFGAKHILYRKRLARRRC
jgi:hypothetical protein